MEISLSSSGVQITSEKKNILLSEATATIDDLQIDFPGEYEKSGILVHVTELDTHLVYELRIEGRMVAYVPTGITEGTEALSNALENIDILILPGSKETTKLSEFLDARIVIPYGESRDQFLIAFGQNLEPQDKYKPKEADFDGESTMFVYLA